MNDIRRRHVPADSWPAEHAATITANGWTVANAARPLPGEITWKGNFTAGVYYAAGPAETYGDHWRELDATVLVPVTPAEVVGKMREFCTENGYTLEGIVSSYDGAAATLAADLDMPWNDAWLAHSAPGWHTFGCSDCHAEPGQPCTPDCPSRDRAGITGPAAPDIETAPGGIRHPNGLISFPA